MSEYFNRSTYHVPSVMDIDNNEDEQEALLSACLNMKMKITLAHFNVAMNFMLNASTNGCTGKNHVLVELQFCPQTHDCLHYS